MSPRLRPPGRLPAPRRRSMPRLPRLTSLPGLRRLPGLRGRAAEAGPRQPRTRVDRRGDHFGLRDLLSEAAHGIGARPGRLILTIIGTVLVISAMFLLVNIIVDLLIAFINPRIRYSQRAS